MGKTKKSPSSVGSAMKSIAVFLAVLLCGAAILTLKIGELAQAQAAYAMTGVCALAAFMSMVLSDRRQGREAVVQLIALGIIAAAVLIWGLASGEETEKNLLCTNLAAIMAAGLLGVLLKKRIQRVKKPAAKKRKYK